MVSDPYMHATYPTTSEWLYWVKHSLFRHGTAEIYKTARMYQLSSSAFALLIVDVEEFHDNKLRRSHKSPTCENLSLPNLNIKTESALE